MGTGGASSGATGSCTESSEGYNLCSLYIGLSSAQEQSEMALCNISGMWGTSCATEGALGSCTEHVAGLTDVVTYYPSPGVTADDLSGTCQAQGGVWTPG
jgi:hypothetical protein